MLIKIYNYKGIEQAELSPNDNSTLVEEIQGDSILALSFTHFDYLELDVDFYTDFEGKRYWLTEKYKPKQNNKKEWVYDVKFYGVESMLKRLLVIKTVDDEEDPVFTLTAPPHEHVAMIVDCMNKGMGNISDWKVGRVDGVANIVIDYFGKYCDEALREIAEKTGGEWWAEGQTVNICKCEHGEPVTLGYGNGLLSIDPGTADNVKFYTRLYPVGSSKNIDKDHYGFSRLQLPDGKKFVEINADKYGRVDHYEQDAFSEIYPRRIGTVSSVRSEEVTGEDGNPFTIYYFKDSSLSFDPNDYLLPEKVIRVSFQEGSELGGLGNEDNGTYYFEVNFDSKTREFEIITIWPYGDEMQLPGDLLEPKPGDKYILWNLRMPDEYYALAEQEFLEAVNKYNEDHGLDIAVYKAPTDHVWIEQNKIDLSIGRRVRLESDEYFPGIGYRDSRITKITRKVNLPSSMDIEISDALSRTSQQKMSDSIADAKNYARSIGESVSLPDIIRTGDNTLPTDNNLYSARRTKRDFLSKAEDDSTPHSLSIGGQLRSVDFRQGSLPGEGEGWGLYKDENRKSVGEFDRVIVREDLQVNTLTVNQIKAIGGMNLYSIASIEVSRVEETPSYYRCYFDLKEDYIANLFQTDDIGYCHRFRSDFSDNCNNASEFTQSNSPVKFYKRRIVGIGKDYIDLTKGYAARSIQVGTGVVSDTGVSGSGVPAKGDVIAQFGNYTDKSRQFIVVLDVQGGGYMRFLGGLDWVNANGREYGFQGYQSSTGERWFVGDKDKGQWAEFVDGRLSICGELSVQSKVGDKSLEQYIKNLIPDFSITQEDIEQFVKNITGKDFENLQSQIDGAIETWYSTGEPTMSNYPASQWNKEDYAKHEGDLYYDRESGYAYRFMKDGDVYKWVQIRDEGIAKALGEAEAASNLAKSKRTIYGVKPIPPYEEDDLWVDATYPEGNTETDADKGRYCNDILRCKNSRKEGESFNINDWELASKYTDDKLAQEAHRKIAGFDYLKDAMENGSTTVLGGLVLSSLIQLGTKDSNGQWNVWSGISGQMLEQSKGAEGIAAWYGGEMWDIENDFLASETRRYAQSLFRFDGSGYLAGGNITWKKDGSGSVGKDSKGNPVISWDSTGVTLSDTIKLGTSSETLSGILTFMNKMNNMFTLEENENGTKVIRANYDGFYSYGFVSAKGKNDDGGASGGMLDFQYIGSGNVVTDVKKSGNIVTITYGNISQGLDTAALASYLASNNYAKKSDITWDGVSGKPSWIGATKPSYSWGEINGKPTTLSGYGILDELNGLYVKKSGDTMTGKLTVNSQLEVKNEFFLQSGIINMGAEDTNIFYASGSAFRFVLNGEGASITGSYLDIFDDGIYGKLNSGSNLGSSARRWNGLYSVTGDFATSVKIGGATLTWDGTALKINTGFYSESFISAKGKNNDAGGGGGGFGQYLILQRNGVEIGRYNGSTQQTINISVPDYANYISNLGNLTAVSGTTTMPSGLRLYSVYNNGYPCTYGNLLRIGGGGSGELLAEWKGDTSLGRLYYRSKRDVADTSWSAWGTVAYLSDLSSYATTASLANYVLKSGDTMTGQLKINMASPTDIYVVFQYGGSNKGAVGYDNNGTYLWTSNSNKKLLWTNNGTLTVPGQINSTVTTGTAPMTVASTTVVTNLNADLLDGVDGSGYGRAYSGNYHFGGSQTEITTAQFITLLTNLGAFNQPHWVAKGSWSYANNYIITDTGIGNIQLAGAVVEVFGVGSAYTIRITTSPTATNSGVTNAVFIYRNHGNNYSPNWKRLANTSDNVASATYATSANYATSSGNADTLDGLHNYNFVKGLYGDECNTSRDMNDMYSNISFVGSINSSANAPNGTGWYNVVQIAHRNGSGDGPSYVGQIALGMTVNHERMYYRTHRTRAWQTVARLTDNVASATQLQTTRYIWGQAFNGSGNVSGNMTGVGSITASVNDYTSADYANKWSYMVSSLVAKATCNILFGKAMSAGNIAYIGHRHIADGSNQNGIVLGGHSYNDLLFVRYDGNIGVGTTSPSSKLHVVGTGYFTSSLTVGGTLYVYSNISCDANLSVEGNVSINGTQTNAGNIIPDSTASYNLGNTSYYWLNAYARYISSDSHLYLSSTSTSYAIYLRGGTTTWATLNSTGLGIGVTPSFKLHVSGNTCLDGGVTIGETTSWSYGGTPSVFIARKVKFSQNVFFQNGTLGCYFAPLESGDLCVYVHNNGSYVRQNSIFYYDGTFFNNAGMYSNGYVSAKGQNTSSDLRLKTELRPLNLELAQIANAPSVLFKWKKDGNEDFGSVAQYWQSLNPLFARKDFGEHLTLDYGKLALTSVIEVAKKTLNHEQRIKALERRIKELEKQLGI
ncbi:MAG: hypothetical protein J1E16_09675 [Muribaculaceae bacterium]|nr:hypothetical protein [Muribaculaceae bacterium]